MSLKIISFGSHIISSIKEQSIPYNSTQIVEKLTAPSFGTGMKIHFKDKNDNIKYCLITLSFLEDYENMLKKYFVKLPKNCVVIGFKDEIENIGKYLKTYQIK